MTLPVLACAGDLAGPARASNGDLRPLSPDRPDVTESPITVDAGYFQIEASFLEWTRDGASDLFAVFPTNLKYGLTPHSDLQLLFDLYVWENRTGGEDNVKGFNDLLVRYKRNLWGNDGGKTALAVMPLVKIPTGSDLSREFPGAGLSVPFRVELTDRIVLGLMAELDWEDSEGLSLLHTASVGLDLGAGWGVYAEYAGILAEASPVALASSGLTWLITPNFMLDWGARAGLSDEAEDVTVFTGFTVRF